MKIKSPCFDGNDDTILAFGVATKRLKETNNMLEKGSYLISPSKKLGYFNGTEKEQNGRSLHFIDSIQVFIYRYHDAIFFHVSNSWFFEDLSGSRDWKEEIYPCIVIQPFSQLKITLI